MFNNFEVAPGCLEFLEWATSRFCCRWLSTRCRSGWPDGSRRAFRLAGAPLDEPRWTVLDLIEPAAWALNKTDAIDPVSDFWWIDDDPTDHDRDWLCAHNREGRLLQVSIDRDVGALLFVQAHLSKPTEMTEMQNALDRAVAEGRAARKNGIDIRQNPYGVSTIAGFCWVQGWCSVEGLVSASQSDVNAPGSKGQQRLRIKDVWHKLPPDAQKWIRRMTRNELQEIERTINQFGEEQFLERWRYRQDEFEYFRSLLLVSL